MKLRCTCPGGGSPDHAPHAPLRVEFLVCVISQEEERAALTAALRSYLRDVLTNADNSPRKMRGVHRADTEGRAE